MKTIKYIIPLAAALLLAVACSKKEDPTPEPTPEPVDPELVVSGVPSSAMESGSAVTLKIESKSDGAIKVATDQPAFAGLEDLGNQEYRLSVCSAKDTKVTLSVSQEGTKDYTAAVKDMSIQIKGLGDITLPGPDDAVEGTAVEFFESSGTLVNPERGLYSAHEFHSDKDSPLSVGDVKARRATGHSVLLLEFYLKDFMGSNISAKYVKNIQASLDALREGGVKAIVRFAYTQSESENPWDANVDQVLTHIAQLKSTLQKYEDVIFVLQAGFIGVWGEWYYTTNFTTDSNRKKVSDALLEVLPASRQIELRTPAFKMRLYNYALKDTLSAATAHDRSVKSRLAGHNDCFGADASDKGTFASDTDREFWKADTRYTIMGGETCAVSDYCLCDQTLQDLKDYHWTYLHDGYHQGVLSRWKEDGCFNEIEEKLGYRLVLQDVHYDAIEAGNRCKLTLRLDNKGYAAPMNPREAWLVWVGSDGKKTKSPLGYDPRTWHSGYNAVVTYFTPTTDKGKLYLELSDPLLPGKPDFSIALANNGTFEAKTGYNLLFEIK